MITNVPLKKLFFEALYQWLNLMISKLYYFGSSYVFGQDPPLATTI